MVLGKRVWGVREEFVGCGEGLVEWGMWFSPLSGSVNDAVIYKGRKWIALSCYSQVCLSLSAVFATVSTRNTCIIVVLLCHSTVGDVCCVRNIIRFCGC